MGQSPEGRGRVRVRKLDRRRPWPFVVGVPILKPLLILACSRNWADGEKIPATGGCILVANHISHLDPLTLGHFVYDHGRIPRYLAKSELFTNPVLGGLLRAAGQIPVERLSRNAMGAYDAAVKAVEDGECVVVYPEGTLTRDPALWPMTGKSGAARVALATGCPVIPVGQWGVHEILPPYGTLPKLLPRKGTAIKVGDPVGLDDLRGQRVTPESVARTTGRIMSAITEIVAELRSEQAPAALFDQRIPRRQQIGNPFDRKRER